MQINLHASHQDPPIYDLKFVIGADLTYTDAQILKPDLLLLDKDQIVGNHFSSNLPKKYKEILEFHYRQLTHTGKAQLYRYEITDIKGAIRQMLGVMKMARDSNVEIKVFDLTDTRDYRMIDDLDLYHKTLIQIKSAVESTARIRDIMPEVLGLIAAFCLGDRVFFSLLSEDGSRVESIEEFDPRDADSDKHLYMGIETSKVPWLMAQLHAGKAVKISDVSKLPPQAAAIKALLTAGGTQADLVVPIFIGKDLIGVIGCDSITRHVSWTDTHVRFLQEVGAYLLGRAHMRQIKDELFTRNVEFSTLLAHLPHPIFQINQAGRLLYANEAFKAFLKSALPTASVDINGEPDCERLARDLQFSAIYHKHITRKEALASPIYLNREYQTKEGTAYYQIQLIPVKSPHALSSYLAFFTDLTELLDSQQELGLMQERLKSAIQASHSIIYEWDVRRDQIISSGHLDAPEATTKTDFNGLVNQLHPADRDLFREAILRFVKHGNRTLQIDYRIKTPQGAYIWVSNSGRTIARNQEGRTTRFVGTITDISERKKYEHDVHFLATHDLLTSLRNRNAFETYTSQNNMTHHLILVADMDGLKPMNDIHGHQFGDRALKRIAAILKEKFPDADIISRIGGDEFAVILPPLRREEISARVQQIKETIRHQADLPMETNLSIGYAYSREGEPFESMFQRAEDRMYKDKLTNRTSSKASVVLSLMKSLQEKNLETEAHCRRVEEYCVAIAEAMRLDYHIINELKLLAKLHDIGKIAIPVSILNKPASLSQEEWLMMKQHAEIGARIVSASPNMDTIAEGIRYHHERWDGRGYPEGKKETAIPLTARILSLVDAYDAMTSQRSYNTAKTKKEAIKELLSCSGSQFDPFITDLFVSILMNE